MLILKSVPFENLEISERMGVIFPFIILADAHFSHDTTRNSVLDLPFTCSLRLENLALRHQIGVLQRSGAKRPKLTSGDRLSWICLSRLWRDWRSALAIVKPQTVSAWHRAGFRLFWTLKVRRGQPGRPVISREVRDLIRKMCRENPSWGARRVHGDRLKLGIDIS
jgi:hypothetical protein